MYTLSSPGHGAREAEGARICSRGRDRQKIKIKRREKSARELPFFFCKRPTVGNGFESALVEYGGN
jgi:hypothetical protein